MNIIFTMAGNYQRFRDQGFNIPKYLLPWGNSNVLSKIITELTVNFRYENIILLANTKDHAYFPHIKSIMKFHGVAQENLIGLSETSGQAETALFGVKYLEEKYKSNSPLLIHNIDTILLNRDLNNIEQALLLSDGYVDIFHANSQAYSYVITNSTDEVIEIAEKIVISDKATSGLYGFKNPKIFKSNYSTDTKYISQILSNIMKDKNRTVKIGKLHQEKETIVLGTPHEYINSVFQAVIPPYK